MPAALVRIGELARRAGVPAATLRAWERRYGILEPTRTDGGYRLYGERDERRLKAMLELITEGAAPAEAASRVLAGEADSAGPARPVGSEAAEPPVARAAELRDQLFEALARFDEQDAHRALDRALAAYSVEGLVCEVVIPVLRRTGEWWQQGRFSVAQEHFVSNLIRGRMLALGRGWGAGGGPLAILACPPGESHDIGLICFGLLLRERGWRIAFLGADTPLETLDELVGRLAPEAVVLPATTRVGAEQLVTHGRLELAAPVLLGGGAADAGLAEAVGAELLPMELIAAAERLGATVLGVERS